MTTKTIKKIVLATDFSETSAAAREMALNMRDNLAAELDVVHAFDPVSFEMPAPYYFMPGADNWLRDRLDNLREQGKKGLEDHCREMGVKRFHFLEGNPGEEIVKHAENDGADLIIVGTHGHTGLNRLLLGSVAEYIVRHAEVPVLTVKPPKQS